MLLALLVLAYPVLVYLGLLHFPVKWVALTISALLLLRIFALQRAARRLGGQPLSLLPALLVAIACSLLSGILNHAGALRLIPAVINLACLAGFSSTLRHPPSMIERFARLQEPSLDNHAIAYTRRVTQVWCVFFVINGSIALYTALFSNLQVWTLYNGLIAYVLMGLLFAVEFMVRQRVKARATRSSP